MADRTTYYALDFNRGELKQVTEATAGANGVDTADLVLAEKNALDRINQCIGRIAGPVNAAVIIAAYMDDTGTLDPIIAQLAELVASADILEQYERYNKSDEGQDGQTQRTDADAVRGRATAIIKDIVDSGGTWTSAQVFRRWYYPKGSQGPRASGPMAGGSRFDHRGYIDYNGLLRPGPPDPYDQARSY